MPHLRHTVAQILAKLCEVEVALSNGQPVPQTCCTLSNTEQTHDRWPLPYYGILPHSAWAIDACIRNSHAALRVIHRWWYEPVADQPRSEEVVRDNCKADETMYKLGM